MVEKLWTTLLGTLVAKLAARLDPTSRLYSYFMYLGACKSGDGSCCNNNVCYEGDGELELGTH